MRIKTSELTWHALDWAVTKSEGLRHDIDPDASWGMWDWAFDWAQGGPIIEREGITLRCGLHGWDAELPEFGILMEGETPLIAAMRCYVASKLGDEVEIPDELPKVEVK